MSGFCVAKTEGYEHVCSAPCRACRDYEQGLVKPQYPVPALYHVSLDETEHDVFAQVLLRGDQIFRSKV